MLKKVWVLIGLLFLLGCQDDSTFVDIAESSAPHQTTLQVVSELISTVDVMDNLAATHELLRKKGDDFLPDVVDIIFLDTKFDDGDGVEVEIDFGPLGNTPLGVLCKDGIYRAGKIQLLLDKPYSEPDATLAIRMPKENPFYSGDGEHLTKFTGLIMLNREDDKNVSLSTKELVAANGTGDNDVRAELEISKNNDLLGLLNSELEFDGWLEIEGARSKVLIEVIEPLLKKYIHSCAKYVVDGELDIELSNSASHIEVDFDPFEDQACDNEIEVTINGKSIIETY